MKRRHPGFTIIELLVVVAIILVLASLVFVFARRGIDAANASRCLNNVRQLVAAQLSITGDTNGYLIHGGQTPIQGRRRNFAMHFTVQQNDDLSYDSPGEDILKRIKGVQMLSCPVAYNRHQAEMKKKEGAAQWRTYSLNNRIGYDRGNLPGRAEDTQTNGAADDDSQSETAA